MKVFTLTGEAQFGSDGPPAGTVGVIFDSRTIEGELWYFARFDDFKGWYLIPESMVEFDD